jgi:NTP pyrophosphatase (non-canonical NTP hydrolase)
MEFTEYQGIARGTAIYPDLGCNLVYPALKLAGESGEVAEKIGKLMRDKGYVIGSRWSDALSCLSPEEKDQITYDLAKELGDVLWYLAALASELGINFDYVADLNLRKLRDRQARDVLQGSGDDR